MLYYASHFMSDNYFTHTIHPRLKLLQIHCSHHRKIGFLTHRLLHYFQQMSNVLKIFA